MIKFISKRTSLFLLASMLIGLILFTVSRRAAAQGGFDYMCDAWEQYCDDGSGMFGGGDSGGGGGGGGHYCAIPDVSIDGGTSCHASGCRLATGYPNTWVCDYRRTAGTGTCPPLEMCQ